VSKAKPFNISKQEAFAAYEQVKANKGAGVDGQSLGDFEWPLIGTSGWQSVVSHWLVLYFKVKLPGV
jgi:hypothetical protein